MSPRLPPSRIEAGGAALVAVLWVTALLSLMAVVVLGTARTSAKISRVLLDRSQSEALVDSAVDQAILALVEPDSVHPWLADGLPKRMGTDAGQVAVAIFDEAGKVDINQAPEATLTQLLKLYATSGTDSEKLARRIVARRDSGNFEALHELQQIPGITPQLYACIQADLTVYSGLPGVDTRFASARLLKALQSPLSQTAPAVAVQPAPDASASNAGRVLSIFAKTVSGAAAPYARKVVIRVTGDPQGPYWVMLWLEVFTSSAEPDADCGPAPLQNSSH